MDWTHYQSAPPPSGYGYLNKNNPRRWPAIHKALYLMCMTGWSTVNELGAAMAEFTGLDNTRSFAVRRVFQTYLPELDLAVYDTLPYLARNGLGVARLSLLGQAVCDRYGWKARLSDWYRLIAYHDGLKQVDHTGVVLAFAREARLRGYQVNILPDIDDDDNRSRPDASITKSGERLTYVEVEAGYHREKFQKWRNQVDLQGFVAVVAKTPQQRARIVSDAIHLGLPGKASDLKTLSSLSHHSQNRLLFIQRWDRLGKIETLSSHSGAQMAGP